MARETKQDRVSRSMLQPMNDHMHEMCQMIKNVDLKETDVERWCQSLLKTALGFSAVNGYVIKAQEGKGKHRPDLIVVKNEKPICVVEVKKLGFNLDKSDFRCGKAQLAEYLKSIGGVTWGILSNGHEWRLYDFSDPAVGGVEIASIDIRNDEDQLDTSKKETEEAVYKLIDFHETSYSDGTWSALLKEAIAFSPESLARAILSADVIKQIAKVIRGEHDHKVNVEIVTDRVFDLLNLGLDDSVVDWNETRQAELQKYVRSQKKASRKKKKLAKTQTQDVAQAETSAITEAVGSVQGEVSSEIKS